MRGLGQKNVDLRGSRSPRSMITSQIRALGSTPLSGTALRVPNDAALRKLRRESHLHVR